LSRKHSCIHVGERSEGKKKTFRFNFPDMLFNLVVISSKAYLCISLDKNVWLLPVSHIRKHWITFLHILLYCYVFSVLQYGCENWTLIETLTKRI